MHSSSPFFLLALTLLLVLATADLTKPSRCICDYPNQMHGTGYLLIVGGEKNGDFLIPGGSSFDVDFSAQKARFYNMAANPEKWHYLDYQAMRMYTFDSDPKTSSTPSNCTSAEMPSWMKLPSCLPTGSKYDFFKSHPVYGQVDHYSRSRSRYSIRDHVDNTCKPVNLMDYRSTDDTFRVARVFSLKVDSFSLTHPGDLNPGSTSACRPVNFPW